MDTRNKIRPAAQAAALRHQAAEQKKPLRVATGHFDPLLVEHARLLGEFARPEAWLVGDVAGASPLAKMAVKVKSRILMVMAPLQPRGYSVDAGPSALLR